MSQQTPPEPEFSTLAGEEYTPIPFGSFADYEIEFRLIGAVLRQGTLFEELADQINADKFHNAICTDIWMAMGRVREHGLILDAITVADQLERDGLLSTLKFSTHIGRMALSLIREEGGNPKNVMSYVDNVVDYWAKRQLDVVAQSVTVQSRNGRRANDILSDLRTKIDMLDVSNGKVSNKTFNAGQLASMAYDHTDTAAKGTIKGIKLGFLDLDRFVTLMASDLFLIAGRPGQGKSGFLYTVGLNLAKVGKKIALFTLEMSAKQATIRMLAQLSSVATDKIREGKLPDGEWPAYTQAIEEFEHLPIVMNDQAGLTIPQANTELRRMIRTLGGCDLVLIDYIQLMRSVRKVQRRDQEIGELSRGLKQLAKDFDLPVLAAAQLSRAVEARAGGRPILSDLRESGDLENDADGVMFIYRPPDQPTMAEIIVAKQRNGSVGSAELVFRAGLTKFENASLRPYNPNIQTRERADTGD